MAPRLLNLLLVLQGCSFAALLALALVVRRLLRQPPPPPPPSDALARELGASINRLAAELQAEHERLAQSVAQARELVTALGGVQSAPEPRPQLSPAALAREQARLSLAAGHSPEQVAESSGLPVGEVKLLANLLKAKGEAAPADIQPEG